MPAEFTTTHKWDGLSDHKCDKCKNVLGRGTKIVVVETQVNWFRGDDEIEAYHRDCYDQLNPTGRGLFAKSVEGLLDSTNLHTRKEWGKILGAKEETLDRWTTDDVLPHPPQRSSDTHRRARYPVATVAPAGPSRVPRNRAARPHREALEAAPPD